MWTWQGMGEWKKGSSERTVEKHLLLTVEMATSLCGRGTSMRRLDPQGLSRNLHDLVLARLSVEA